MRSNQAGGREQLKSTLWLLHWEGVQGNPACVCQSSALPVPDTQQRYPCRTKDLGPLKGNRTEEVSQAVLIGNGVGGGIRSRFSTQFLVPFVKIWCLKVAKTWLWLLWLPSSLCQWSCEQGRDVWPKPHDGSRMWANLKWEWLLAF